MNDPQRIALINTMIENDGHPNTLRVMADWLEQQGACDLAYAYRWAASRNRWPKIDKAITQPWRVWWSRLEQLTDKRFVIPPSIKIQMNRDFMGSDLCELVEGAFQELADALARIKGDVSIDSSTDY